MPRDIRFSKYSICGNTFAVIDERRSRRVCERRKGQVARRLCSPQYGLGCDKVIYVQEASGGLVEEWRKNPDLARWWSSQPRVREVLVQNAGMSVVRAFSRNGDEGCLCCNSIIAAHSYLRELGGESGAKYLTCVPAERPRVVSAISDSAGTTAIDVGEVDWPSNRFFAIDAVALESVPGNQRVRIYRCEVMDTDLTQWEIAGYLAVVGEPHLIILCEAPLEERGLVRDDLSSILRSFFVALNRADQVTLLRRLGSLANCEENPLLRSGVSVSVASIGETSLRIGTYERNSCSEVEACGTAAIAAAATALALGFLSPDGARQQLLVLPFGADGEWAKRPTGFVQESAGRWTYAAPVTAVADGTVRYGHS